MNQEEIKKKIQENKNEIRRKKNIMNTEKYDIDNLVLQNYDLREALSKLELLNEIASVKRRQEKMADLMDEHINNPDAHKI